MLSVCAHAFMGTFRSHQARSLREGKPAPPTTKQPRKQPSPPTTTPSSRRLTRANAATFNDTASVVSRSPSVFSAVSRITSRFLGTLARARGERPSTAGMASSASSASLAGIDPGRLARVFQTWSVSEVLEVLMEQYVLHHAEHLDTEKWRRQVLYTQAVSEVFAEFLPLVRRLFDRYACMYLPVPARCTWPAAQRSHFACVIMCGCVCGWLGAWVAVNTPSSAQKRPSAPLVMDLEEFLQFCKQNHLLTRLVTQREVCSVAQLCAVPWGVLSFGFCCERVSHAQPCSQVLLLLPLLLLLLLDCVTS